MALKPTHTAASPSARPNETAIAIGASAVIALVLGTLLTGNPFRAFGLAYSSYTHTQDAGSLAPAPAPAK